MVSLKRKKLYCDDKMLLGVKMFLMYGRIILTFRVIPGFGLHFCSVGVTFSGGIRNEFQFAFEIQYL